MTLREVAKFKEKLTCGLKNEVGNLVNFHVSSRKSKNLSQKFTLIGSFCPKHTKIKMKMYRRVMSHDTEE